MSIVNSDDGNANQDSFLSANSAYDTARDTSLHSEQIVSSTNVDTTGDNNSGHITTVIQPINNASPNILDGESGGCDESGADDLGQQGARNATSTVSNGSGNEPNARRLNDEPKPNASVILPIFEVRADNDEILEELEERCVETLTFERVAMEVTYNASKGFGKPFNTSSDGRVQHFSQPFQLTTS